jgi:hypothetical protein
MVAVAWLTCGCNLWQGPDACQFSWSRLPARGLFMVLLLSLACGRGKQEGNEAGQRARDSTIGASALPGAAGVRGALSAADSAAARNSRIDSVER